MKVVLRKLTKKCAVVFLIGTMFYNSLVCLADTYNKEDYTQQEIRENYSYGSVKYSAYLGYNQQKCGAYLGVNASEPVRVILNYNVYHNLAGSYGTKKTVEAVGSGSVSKVVTPPFLYSILDCQGVFYISNMSSPVWTKTIIYESV